MLNVIDKKPVGTVAALSALVLPSGTYFFTDTYVNPDPSAAELVEITLLAAEEVSRLGIKPKVALISHSNFGNADTPSARKMRDAVRMLHERAPDLDVEGEMHADAAISETIRNRIFPHSRLQGSANLLVMPTLDAANSAFNLAKVLGEGLHVGPMLLGITRPAHIVTPSVTARGIVNVTALAVVDAQADRREIRSLRPARAPPAANCYRKPARSRTANERGHTAGPRPVFPAVLAVVAVGESSARGALAARLLGRASFATSRHRYQVPIER